MSTKATKRMLATYEQSAAPTAFFTRQFKSPKRNFHKSQSVEIDIERSDEDVATVIQDLTTGVRMNTLDIYTNKEFVPPIYDEAFTLNAFDLSNRQPGVNPFEDFSFLSNATLQFFKGARLVERKIRRAIELQASQVLQTGTVSLIDNAGTVLYTIDYKPKSTHFPTASPVWDGTSPLIEKDIADLCDVIRADGQRDPDVTQWGARAFQVAMQDTLFKAKFDPRRADTGRISPMKMDNSGGQFRGVLDIGNYQLEVWTYNGFYKHPSSAVVTSFMSPTKVVVRASSGRLDATFGAIPMALPPEKRVLPFMPPRMTRAGGAMDMTTNTWVNDSGKNVFGSVGTRPLLIPTAIDTFGCIDTGIT